MCGRYYWDDSTFDLIDDFADECDVELKTKKHDFSPGEKIPVLVMKKNKMVIEEYIWGYSMNMNSKLVINARSETILEKNMFKEDIRERRCLIASKGFYEWDSHKHQVSFENQEDILWMAGIYRQKEKEVTIITTQANSSVRGVHSRMPLIIHKEDIKKWLTDDASLSYFLSSVYDDLDIVSGNIQQSLFDD